MLSAPPDELLVSRRTSLGSLGTVVVAAVSKTLMGAVLQASVHRSRDSANNFFRILAEAQASIQQLAATAALPAVERLRIESQRLVDGNCALK